MGGDAGAARVAALGASAVALQRPVARHVLVRALFSLSLSLSLMSLVCNGDSYPSLAPTHPLVLNTIPTTEASTRSARTRERRKPRCSSSASVGCSWRTSMRSWRCVLSAYLVGRGATPRKDHKRHPLRPSLFSLTHSLPRSLALQQLRRTDGQVEFLKAYCLAFEAFTTGTSYISELFRYLVRPFDRSLWELS